MIAALIISVWPADALSEVRIGATGGLSRYSYSGDKPDKAAYTKQNRATFGGLFEMDVHKGVRLSIQPSYMQKGTGIACEAVDRVAGNEWYYAIGGLASFDLSRRTGSPIGLALGYRYTTIPEGGDEIVDNALSALINISYMGRPDFHIGLDLQLQRVPIQGVEDPAEFFTAVISSQYFF